jgi:hypothetical protein
MQDKPKREKKKKEGWHPLYSCLMPIVAMLIILAVTIFAFIFWVRTIPHNDTTIPDLIGASESDARTALVNMQLNVVTDPATVYSDEIGEGKVIRTIPTAGKVVKAGRTVRMIISSGSGMTEVPELTELTEYDARKRLTEAGLRTGNETYATHPRIEGDRVISVKPKEGTRARRGSTVDLLISSGKESFETLSPPPAIGADDLHTTTIVFTVPMEVDTGQLEIRVEDKDGNHNVYKKDHTGGEEITETVQGNGPSKASVFFNDKLEFTRKF